jgi:hypothetical protein
MAGYDGYSQLNNAIEAERAGLMIASDVARVIGRGATAAGVTEVLTPAAKTGRISAGERKSNRNGLSGRKKS